MGYRTIYQGSGINVDGITFKVVGACDMYRAFCSCTSLGDDFEFVWETDQTVSVQGLFCDINMNINPITKLKTFNLTSCGSTIFTGSFFGGIGSVFNTTVTDFECTGVQSVSLDLTNMRGLNKQSVMNIINCLCETSSTLTLKLYDTQKALLTADDIKIATDKGWTVA
jgi:hypothetical protein